MCICTVYFGMIGINKIKIICMLMFNSKTVSNYQNVFISYSAIHKDILQISKLRGIHVNELLPSKHVVA
jgi:hypothetical protein